MRKKTILKIFSLILLTASSLAIESCTKEEETDDIEEIKAMLDSTSSEQLRYAELNRIAKSLHEKSPTDMPLFLTEWVETHPEDPYNAYWLFMVASSYLENSKKDMGDSKPIAEYYFERIIRNYPDLLVNGQSIHFASLEHLIEISKNPSNRIFYFNRLINGFPKNVSKTEMYVRLALEYENEGEWDQALDAYTHFLEQPDASTIQIAGIPDAYANARKMVDFSNSPKDWTFDTLDALEKAVKSAITRYDWSVILC